MDLYGLQMSGLPPEHQAKFRAMQQQQAMAQAMLAQSQDPLANQAPGVAVSPFQGLAKVAQAYLGAKGLQNANKGYQAIGEQYTNDQNAAIAKVQAAMAPAPAQNPVPMANADGVHGEMIEKSLDQKQAVVRDALMNQFPNVRSYASTMNSDLQQEKQAAALKAHQIELLDDKQKDREAASLRAIEETKRQEVVKAEERERDRKAQSELKQLVIASRQTGEKGDKAPAGYRYKQDGSLEAIPGGPADQKQTTALNGRETVSSIVGTLRDHFSQLSEGGGIVDANKGALSNIAAGLGSSGLGQAVGKMVGTGNQSQRNSIEMTRPLLLQAIMKATGMSAKQMDSNTELKLYLSTATNPQLDRDANLLALDKLESLYGIGDGGAPKAPPASAPATNGWSIRPIQ